MFFLLNTLIYLFIYLFCVLHVDKTLVNFLHSGRIIITLQNWHVLLARLDNILHSRIIIINAFESAGRAC